MGLLEHMRRLLQRGSPPGEPRFVIHKNYQIDIPFPQYDQRRPFRILRYLERRHLLRRGMLRRPRPVSLERLQRVHTAGYLRSLQEPAAMEAILGLRLTAAAQDEFIAWQRLMSGGTLLAAHSALRRHGLAINLGGGFHHAARGQGSGFCVFNDIAVAVDFVREKGHRFPILVVDLDLHDGDGTRSIFADDPSVHTFSIHNRTLGEANAVAATTIPLGGDVTDDTYLTAVRTLLPPVFEAVKPGLVFYLAGSDPSVDDRLGDWRISDEGLRRRDRLVIDLVRPRPGQVAVPTVILLAGGYGPRAWRHGAALFAWLLNGDNRLDIPLEMELPLDHYRRLARLMKYPDPSPEADTVLATGTSAGDSDWGLTEADLGLAAAGPQSDPAPLFLGLYSRHGLEVALEESGLLGHLRQRGFRDLQLEMDFGDPLGQLLRLVSGRRPRVVVIEIKLRVHRATPGRPHDLLVVEWLLLQDARPAEPGSDRALLPGQEFPGVGLLRDMAAVLVVAAERLGLDGIAFTPSHYHLARLARAQGRFPAPEHEARYLALEKAVAGMTLSEAATAVAGGRVRNATGEVIAWQPEQMIIPVGAALRDSLHGDVFRAKVTDALQNLEFRLEGPTPSS